MNRYTKMAAGLLSVSMLAALALPASASAAETGGAATKASAPAAYTYQKLTGNVSAEVKSVLCDRTEDGTRIAAVVRLVNNGTGVARVPDYELHAVTDAGIDYSLVPSSANPRSMQPKEEVELSYLLTVNRDDELKLKSLKFVHVNEYVYPKQETLWLNEDVSAIVWRGEDSAAAKGFAVANWGQAFSIPGFVDGIVYTPTTLVRESTAQGTSAVVALTAENKGKQRQAVPDFRIGVFTKDGLSSGGRIEKDAILLSPGEKRQVHIAVPVQADDVLRSLVVLSPESFIGAGASGQAASVPFQVGRLQIQLPDPSAPKLTGAPAYQYGTPIAFDPLNKLIGDNLQVALVELHMHENDGDGFQTAVAKFKVMNRSNIPVQLPSFQARLSSDSGFSYDGARQNLTNTALMPNLSYVVDYSFALPSTETGEDLKLTVMDGQTTAPFTVPIATLPVAVQSDDGDNGVLHLYPFDVKVNYWAMNSMVDIMGGPLTYSYKLKLDLDIARSDEVVVDANFSKLRIELSDSAGRVVGAETKSFVGPNRLISGTQQIAFTNIMADQITNPLTIKLYEVTNTPNGEAKRLLQTLSEK